MKNGSILISPEGMKKKHCTIPSAEDAVSPSERNESKRQDQPPYSNNRSMINNPTVLISMDCEFAT